MAEDTIEVSRDEWLALKGISAELGGPEHMDVALAVVRRLQGSGTVELVEAAIAFRTRERELQLKLEKRCRDFATWAAMEMPGLMPVGPANSELRALRRSVNEGIRPILDELRELRGEGKSNDVG